MHHNMGNIFFSGFAERNIQDVVLPSHLRVDVIEQNVSTFWGRMSS